MTKYTKLVMFRNILNEAQEAGRKAALALTPIPMVVGEAKSILSDEIDYTKPTYYVADGVCGFAWVNITPGTSAFARWLKKEGLAHKSYDGGVNIWISDYNQSMQKKEAHAQAMAQVFKANGINAIGMSRLD